jgi:hypothetical protein
VHPLTPPQRGKRAPSGTGPGSVQLSLYEITMMSVDWWGGFVFTLLQGLLAGTSLWVLYTALTSETQIA